MHGKRPMIDFENSERRRARSLNWVVFFAPAGSSRCHVSSEAVTTVRVDVNAQSRSSEKEKNLLVFGHQIRQSREKSTDKEVKSHGAADLLSYEAGEDGHIVG